MITRSESKLYLSSQLRLFCQGIHIFRLLDISKLPVQLKLSYAIQRLTISLPVRLCGLEQHFEGSVLFLCFSEALDGGWLMRVSPAPLPTPVPLPLDD